MGRLILQPFGGLCNRLQAVVSASLLAEELGREFQVDWRPDPACGCLASDLFRELPGSEAFPNDAPFFDTDEIEGLSAVGHEDIRIRSQGYLRPASQDPERFEREFVHRLQSLEPLPSIAHRVLELPPGTIGLHIRRGDHWPSTRYSPLHLFHRVIEERGLAQGETSLFLATDSPDVTASLLRRYGPRLLHVEGKTHSRASAPGVADALVDLLTLARTQVIYGSAQSSFAVTASRWGGAPLHTVTLPGAPPDFSGTVLDRLHQRFLRYDPATSRWLPRTARTPAGRAVVGLLSPMLLRRAAIAASDAYQEGRARLRF